MTVLLTNVHSDNFGDTLNARSGARIARCLGGGVEALVYTRNPWTARVDGMDDVSHEFFLRGVRWASLDVHLHSRRVAHACPNRGQWSALQSAVERVTLVLSVPGGPGLGLYRDASILMPFVAAERCSVPAAMAYGSVHPSGSRRFDALTVRALQSAVVAVRDETSRRHLQRQGVPHLNGFDVSANAVAELAGPVRPFKSRRPVISVVIGDDLSWHPSYASSGFDLAERTSELLGAAVAAAEQENLQVEVVPNSTLSTEAAYMARVARAVGGPGRVRLRNDVRTASEYVEALASSRAVVALRYHAVLSALVTGTPLVAVSYESKTDDLCAAAGVQSPVDLSALKGSSAKGEIADLLVAGELALVNAESTATAVRSRASLSETMLVATISERFPQCV